ncbi:hypothetical protein H6P81_018433 [Aristolochia fimbriata]|uniref:Uncharacterized protein n=1 Tax=Aristolochia fimbriata TaxID=158543 RepID=A0AAV7E1D5_ARIFI|nr:hypothetical protein H6P81_018433 [Aristolochia fimbriata]
MATAVGSETATTKTADESLWWDSFIVLFNELENAVLDSELPRPLAIKLKSNHAWFLDSIHMFKRPNAVSKSALEAQRVSIGSKRLVVEPELKDAALVVSSLLCLDEVQSYLILKRGIEQNIIPSDPKEQGFPHLVLLQYFLERQCLLKCIREILSRTLYAGNEANDSNAVREEALQLISDGLERKLFSTLQDLVDCKHLEHMDVDMDTLWVEEGLIEVNLVLDILFVTYYETFCTCKFEQWKTLCSLFKGILSDSLSIGNLAISIEARNSLYQVKVKLLLILIETLDLESLLGMVHDGVSFRNGNFMFSMTNIQEMDSIISSFNTLDTVEAGPLVLAWAVFLCLTGSLPERQEDNMLVEIDHIGYVRQAFEAAPMRYFLEILDSNVLKDSDSPVTGYRSVMRTSISAFVASYEISHQLEDCTFNQILDVLCKIYRGEESLCVQFWDKESFVDSPIRSLLCSLEAEFPYRIVELVRLLSALGEGAWPAKCVYNFLDKIVGVASLFEIPATSSVESICQIVETSHPLYVPGLEGFFIPSGTRGRILKAVDRNIALVRWECMQSGIYILLLRLAQDFHLNSYEDVFVILDLLCRLVSFNMDLCFALMNVNNSFAVRSVRVSEHLDNTTCVDAVKIICVMINKLAFSTSSAGVLSMCTKILCKMLKCSPSHVVEVASSTNILDLGTSSPSSGMWLLSRGLSKLLLVDCEQNEDNCSLTMSVIEFAIQLVEAGVDNNAVSSLAVYLLQFVLVNHEQWKYKLRHTRWGVTLKVLELAKQCIKSVSDTSRQGCLVRDILLGDSSIHNTLFRIMCITTPALERLYVCRLYEMKEIEGLYLGVHSVLDIVYTILLNFSKDMHLGLSVFHQAVLSSETKPIPVAKAAMSLLSLFSNPAIQVAAAKVLSILCIIAGKVQPYSLGNISFVSDEMQIKELTSSVQIILFDGSVINEDCSVAVLKLLTSAALYQPAFLLSIISIKDKVDVPLNNGGHKETPVGSLQSNNASLLNSLLSYIGKSVELVTSHPHLLLNVLNFLKALWEGAAQYGEIIETLKKSDNFWGKLSSILPVCSGKKDFSFENLKGNEALPLAHAFQAQATVLEIMAHEIFMQNRMSHNNLLDLEKILLSWFEGSVIEDLIKSYASCGHEDRSLRCAKISACQCIVHLIGKLYARDTGSLSISLLEKLLKVSKKLSEQPAFTELLAQYTSHGYSDGKDLNALILSDLFYHLQGELDGREMSPGPFKELSLYLLQLNIFCFKQCKSDVDFSLENSNAYLYDTKHLKKHLGLEYWGHSRWEASKEIAEKMLLYMNYANNTVLNMVARHSALKALRAIITVLFGNVVEAKPASLGGNIDDKLLKPCVDQLCNKLQSTAESLVTAPGVREETLGFFSTQTELLLIITKVLNRRSTLKPGGPERVPISLSMIKTLVSVLKVLADVESSTSGLKRAVHVFLTLLLTSLQFNYPKSNIKENQLVVLDTSTEVSLSALSLLPILCNFLEIDEYYDLSLSTIDTILKALLTPNSWLPIIQRHLNFPILISKLYVKDSFTSTSILLKFLLTLARTKGGARMLQNENLFTYLKNLFSLLFEKLHYSSQAENNLSVVVNNEEKTENFWSLGLAIVSAMIYSLGEESSVDIVESVIPYFLVEKAYMVSYYLSVPPFPTDDHSKKRARTQKAHISLTSLVEIEHTLMLVCTLAKHQRVWSKASMDMDSELRERSIHLLAFLSRGGQRVGEGIHKTTSVFCPPVLKKEMELSGRPPFVNSKHGWFALAALCCEAKTADSALSSGSFTVNLNKDQFQEHAHLGSQTCFSDLVAIQMYRIAFLLLNFLCHQAKAATKRAEEVGFIDLKHFPELPMPEILHGIQDQAVAVVTELCRGDKSKVVQTEIQSICLLLLQIIEKGLYLELCVSQSCGIRPVLGRVEDFSKEIKTLMQVAEQHPFLKASLKSVKQIMTLVYPSLLQEGIL